MMPTGYRLNNPTPQDLKNRAKVKRYQEKQALLKEAPAARQSQYLGNGLFRSTSGNLYTLDPNGVPLPYVATLNRGDADMPTESDQERQTRTGLSSLEASDQASAAVQKTPHRVSLDSLLAKIMSEEYWHPAHIAHMTICVIVTENGYAVVGKSAPADAANYDEALGKKFAKEDALRQLWPLEAYLLRERLSL